MTTLECDVLILGSGLAGLMAALRLGRGGASVLLVSKRDLTESNTRYAQGGIACVISAEDSIESHVQDTLATGGGLCREDVVRAIVSAGPARVRELEELGISFERRTEDEETYDLGQEGGHTHRRVLHAGDITGQELIRVLLEAVEQTPAVTRRPNLMAIDLVTTGWLGQPGENRCVGAYLLDRETGEIQAVHARATILATGGAGKVYLYTSNPDVATGDGIALAWRAGLPIANMEFVQFHPTCLYHPEAKSFLISEAVRGEGARLLNSAGESFTERADPRGSLAPRDIVARAIDHEMKRRGDPCVYLDITHKPAAFLLERFPNIYATCLRFGIDMARDRIPVVPAAHYFCGGVLTGVNGATGMPGLYAVGETACTGLHGANRLASNSLLEALVCSTQAAETILASLGEPSGSALSIPDWVLGDAVPSDEAVVVEHNWNEVRTCMWDYVGIVRSHKRLERALRRVRNIRREIRTYYRSYLVNADLLELRNIAAVAELIIRCAMMRQESRGLHYSLDTPVPDPSRPVIDSILRDPPGGPVPD
ncbi:MAG: L-aspartate oxidase [Kiritimatiellia bacterium]|nr:L-aspartate oxidase [Kiritimatiellia bacterium]